MRTRAFGVGDPVPWFQARASNGSGSYDIGSVAGRYVVLCFLGSAAEAPARRALAAVAGRRQLFDDWRASFFGISVDPADQAGRLRQELPGIRFFWDTDHAISRLYGASQGQPAPAYRGGWLVLDPMLRVLASAPLEAAEQVLDLVAGLPPVDGHAGGPLHAPVLVLPRVFEPEFCRALIAQYELHGGEPSGIMREEGGKTVTVLDDSFKRRADFLIVDEMVRSAVRERLLRRVVPAVAQAFQFRATRMERYIVACYDAGQGGYFRAHRDNTTKGTAHRRFAVTINLNAEDFAGGELRFPEFGTHGYRSPTGAAVVFSCSLLHEVVPVTAGRRFAFLPFLYDEPAARQRVANSPYLGADVDAYRPDGTRVAGTAEPPPALDAWFTPPGSA